MRLFLSIIAPIILFIPANPAVHQLTTSGDDLNPCWSPDGSEIVFESLRTIPRNIWVMNADGTNQHNVSNSSYGDWNPEFSPDGSKIAFNSDRFVEGVGDIYTMLSNGGDVTRLTTTYHDLYPTWSPDGDYIAYEHGGPPTVTNIWKIPSTGGIGIQLTFGDYDDWDPAWSPDGNKIAFDSNRFGAGSQIYTMSPNGQNIVKIVDEGVRPCWSPDSTKIAYCYYNSEYHWNIFVVPAVGGTPQQITFFTDLGCTDTSWSPDGTKIVFGHEDDWSNSNIWYVDVDLDINVEPASLGQIKANYK